jgi:hypothetical protein
VSWERSSPALTIDGDRVTCWFTGDGQSPGQWFELRFDTPQVVKRVVLDHHGEQTIFTSDWPRGLTARVTEDGTNWREATVTQAGIMQPALAAFDGGAMILAIRFEATASHQPESWGIHEIFVFGPHD